MRAFVSIFLFLLFAAQTFSSFVLDGMYRFNRVYVAQTLCENKARPQLHCDGKCYLAKQVQKNTTDAAQPSGNKKERGDEAFFFPAAVPQVAVGLGVAACRYHPFPAVSLSSYHHSLLRPPQVFFV